MLQLIGIGIATGCLGAALLFGARTDGWRSIGFFLLLCSGMTWTVILGIQVAEAVHG